MAKPGQGRPPSGSEDSLHKPQLRWHSATQLERKYVGSHTSFTRVLQQLRQKLLADIITAGYSEMEAAALVDDHLIKLLAGREGQKRPVGSDDALRLMDLTDRATVEPEAPEGWISALRLSQERGKDYHHVVKCLKAMYRDATQELRRQGHSDMAAVAEVKQHLVTWVRPKDGKRRIWIASQEAVRQLDTQDILGVNSTPPSDIASRLIHEKESWATRLEHLVADMTASSGSETEAVRTIRRYLNERIKSTADHGEGSRGR